jgi:hypothetical protein
MKEILISVITGIFIYFRKLDYYKTIPRKSVIASALIALWTWLVIKKDPWFIIVGLVILNLIGTHHRFPEQQDDAEYLQN